MFVVLYATESTLQTICSGCGPTVIGIAFMLITVRVGLGWGQGSPPATDTAVRFTTAAGRESARFSLSAVEIGTRSGAADALQGQTHSQMRTVDWEQQPQAARGETKKPEAATLV